MNGPSNIKSLKYKIYLTHHDHLFCVLTATLLGNWASAPLPSHLFHFYWYYPFPKDKCKMKPYYKHTKKKVSKKFG